MVVAASVLGYLGYCLVCGAVAGTVSAYYRVVPYMTVDYWYLKTYDVYTQEAPVTYAYENSKAYAEQLRQQALSLNIPTILGYGLIIYLAYIIVRRVAVLLVKKLQVVRFYCDFSEKMMPGSLLEFTAKMQPFQMEVWVKRGVALTKSGQAFNTNFGIFTAYHVIEDAEEVVLRTEKGKVEIPIGSFMQLEGDVALFVPTAQVTGQLGISQSKLIKIETPSRKAGLLVNAQAFGNKTMGLLKTSEAFGLCEYSGSTIKGFSGAPYYVGKHVYGMHIAGSTVNLGLESAYLHMLAKRAQEDTDDFLQEQIVREGREYTWERSPYDPDEARVKMDGMYFSVDMDFIRKLKKDKVLRPEVKYQKPDYEQENFSGSDLEGEELPIAPRTALSYPDSKNLLAPLAVNAGGIGKRRVQVDAPKVSRNGRPEIDLESLEDSDDSDMDGPVRTRVQPSDHSDITLESLKASARKLGLRVQRKKVKHSKRLLNRTEPGNTEYQEPSTSKNTSK